MGNIFCCKKNKNKKKIVLLLVGLDNAGKTVAAKGLAGESLNSVVPTVGFSVIRLKFRSYKVIVYDLGGGPNIRGIWNKYFVDAHGVIFVVDSSDISRLEEARYVLSNLLHHEKIAGKPLLLLANKQDHENALDEIDIIEELNVECLVNNQQCPTLVESCSATESSSNKNLDPGIKRGYDWLLTYIDRNFEVLNKRVSVDVKEQEAIDKKIMLEKIERIKLMKQIEKRKVDDQDAIESYSDYARKLNIEAEAVEVLKTDNINDEIVDMHSDNSDKSSDSFPPVYHVKTEDVVQDRPKSALQIVKDQLQLKEVKKKSIINRSNKTAPIILYGVPQSHSAKERRATSFVTRRNLKSAENHKNFRSAGDSIFHFTTSTDMPNIVPVGPSGDDCSGEILNLPYLSKSNKPLSLKQSKNGVPWLHKTINGDSGISVIDVD